jgi:hypothetical protein
MTAERLIIPPRIIMLDGSGSISFDVLAWLCEQKVSLIRVDWQGNAQSVLANDGYAANPYRAEDCCGVMLEIIAFFVTLRAEARVVPAGPSGRGIRLHSVIPIGAATPTRLVGTTLRLRHPQSPTTHASTSVQPCEHSF